MEVTKVPIPAMRHPRLAMEAIAGMDLPEWGQIAAQTERVALSSGETLAAPGDSDPYIYFLTAGLLKVQLRFDPSDPGSQVTLFVMEEGDLYGAHHAVGIDSVRRAWRRGLHPRSSHLAGLHSGPDQHTITAIEASTVFRCPGELVGELANRHHEWAHLVATVALLNNAALHQDLAASRVTAETRYRTLLRTRPDLVRRLTQRELASVLNITDSALSRIVKRVREAGGNAATTPG